MTVCGQLAKFSTTPLSTTTTFSWLSYLSVMCAMHAESTHGNTMYGATTPHAAISATHRVACDAFFFMERPISLVYGRPIYTICVHTKSASLFLDLA